MKQELFPVDELAPGERRFVKVDGLDVVVVRTPDGELHALRDICPHVGGRLSRGVVEHPMAGDEVGEYRLDDGYVIRCMWHAWEFDVRTGRCLADPEHARVRRYDVTVEDGAVFLER